MKSVYSDWLCEMSNCKELYRSDNCESSVPLSKTKQKQIKNHIRDQLEKNIWDYHNAASDIMIDRICDMLNTGNVDFSYYPGYNSQSIFVEENPWKYLAIEGSNIKPPKIDIDEILYDWNGYFSYPSVGEDWDHLDKDGSLKRYHRQREPGESIGPEILKREFDKKFTGVCEDCIKYGMWRWHRVWAGRSEFKNEVVCTMGCQDCVRKNKWTWGKFCIPNYELENPWIPIQNNGPRYNGSDESLTSELCFYLLNEIFNKSNILEPTFKDVFRISPKRIHSQILEICGIYNIPSNVSKNKVRGVHIDNCIKWITNRSTITQLFPDGLNGPIINTMPLDVDVDEYQSSDDEESETIPKITESKKQAEMMGELMEKYSTKLPEGFYLEMYDHIKDIHNM
jgi:hypothetical protein